MPRLENGELRVGVAHARADEGERKVAILPLLVEGELAASDRQELTQALAVGLQRGDFKVITPDEVVAKEASATDCRDEGCAKQVAQSTGAQYVVRSRVTIQDRDYTIKVELLDGSSGTSVADTGDGCEICGVADVKGMFSSAAATLGPKLELLAKGPGVFTLTSEPAGAVVPLDGEIVGTTPIERRMVPGKHVLRVSSEGFISIEREVTFVEGLSEDLSISLEKLPSRLPSRPWGWVSLGAGVATLSGGIVLTWMHDRQYTASGQCEGDDVKMIDGNPECRYLYNTKWPAAGVLVAGAALTTLGILILVNSAQKTKKDKKADKSSARLKSRRFARPRFGVGPGSVTVQGQF
jgi:TolB-like protein